MDGHGDADFRQLSQTDRQLVAHILGDYFGGRKATLKIWVFIEIRIA